MQIQLSALPNTLKGPDDSSYKGLVPKRARFMEPAAASALMQLISASNNSLVFTDIYRSPEASLAARRSKRGVQPPGYSGHNFGFSFDLDIAETLRVMKIRYVELIELLRQYGFHCHRRDLASSADESWHQNYFGEEADGLLKLLDPQQPRTWATPLEAKIVQVYGTSFTFDAKELQAQLSRLWLYRGEVDGKEGPLTREAVAAFQRAWGLADDGIAGPRTRRVLAVVASEVELVTTSVSV